MPDMVNIHLTQINNTQIFEYCIECVSSLHLYSRRREEAFVECFLNLELIDIANNILVRE